MFSEMVNVMDEQDSVSILDSILGVMEDQEKLSTFVFKEFKNTSDSGIKVEVEKEDSETENAPFDLTSITCINENESIQSEYKDKLVVEILKNSLDNSYCKELVTAKYEELFPNHTISLVETENSVVHDVTFDMCKIKNEEADIKVEELEINETRCQELSPNHVVKTENSVMHDVSFDMWNVKNEGVDVKEEELEINEERFQELFSNQTMPQMKPDSSVTFDMRDIKNEEVDVKEEKLEMNETNMSLTGVFRIMQQENVGRKVKNQHNRALEKINSNGQEFQDKNTKTTAKMFKCDFTTIRRQYLNRHCVRRNSKNTFNDYQSYFEKHLLMHMHSEDVTLLKSNVSAKTPEINVFKCDQCDYKTFQRGCLKIHLLWHRNPEEVNLFKCDQCDYKSTRKCDLKRHLLRHRNPEEVTLFKCDQCDYKSLRKGDLKIHLLRHRNPEEGNLFKCDQCDYKSLRKGDLKRHLLLHRNPEEVTLFKCDQCDYKSLRRGDLKIHLLRHRNPEVNFFKCDRCDYKTFQKCRLKIHLLQHINPEEVNISKCD